MSFIFSLFIFYLSFSNEEMVNNPYQPRKGLNIVNYIFIFEDNRMSLPSEETIPKTPKMKNIKKIFYDSYIYCANFFMYSDKLNNNYLLIDNKLYFSQISNGQYNFIFIMDFPSDIKPIGFINKLFCENEEGEMLDQLNYPPSSLKPNPCFIIYWKQSNILYFYDLDINLGHSYAKI